MAFHTLNITLSGGNDQVTATHTPVRQVGFFNASGNGALLIGDKNISATIYATSVAAGADSPRFGPFAGQLPFNLDEMYLRGTNTNVIRCWYIT